MAKTDWVLPNTSIEDIPKNVVSIAVSKRQPIHRVRAAVDRGWRVFGENKYQEAHNRWVHLRAEHPDIKLHFIGHLQSNKVKSVVDFFDVIHSIDRPSVLMAIASAVCQTGRQPELFLQVNTGREPQKSGVFPKDIGILLGLCSQLGLKISGLMCLPPASEPSGPHFAFLNQLAKRFDMPNLSMGMSGDYEAAVKLGATHIRLGTAFFGARPTEDTVF